MINKTGLRLGAVVKVKNRFEAEGFGWATFGCAMMSLTVLYSTGPLGPVQSISRHPCFDPCLGPCLERFIKLTLL